VLNRWGRPGAWFVTLSLDPASQWQPFKMTYPDGLQPPRPLIHRQLRLGLRLP
jgi:hypothetical protein